MYANATRLNVGYISRDGATFHPSEHFTYAEFMCKDGSDVVIWCPLLFEGLEKIRQHFGGKPVDIDSGYRTYSHHAAIYRNIGIPVKKYSEHPNGRAADIAVISVAPNEVADYAESIGFGGVGRYNTFTHVDTGSPNRRWNG